MQKTKQPSRSYRIVSSAFAVGVVVYFAWLYLRVSFLDSWVQTIRRPEFVLLHKEQSQTHFFALFRTSDSQIAVCWRSFGFDGRFVRSSTIDLRDSDGVDAIDHTKPIEPLVRETWFGPIFSRCPDGEIISLRESNSRLRVSFSSSRHDNSGVIEIGSSPSKFSVELEWPETI